MSFALYGLTAFDVQYWTGSAWATVPGGSVTGNNLVWRKITFAPLVTTKIRSVVNGALSNYSRVAEAEPYGLGTATPVPHSLSLNGVDAYVNVQGGPSLNIVGPVTVEAWVRRNAGAWSAPAIVERYGANGGGYALRIEEGRLCFYTLASAGDFDRLASNSVVSAGVWHHVAGVFDGKQKQIFIDGVLDTSAASAFGPRTGTAGLRIGAAGGAGGDYFSGLIDEVRVTAAARYVTSFTPSPAQGADRSDTRGLWNFDAQTAHDASGNNHGTFAGGAYCSTACPAAEKAPAQWFAVQAADQPVKIDFDLYLHGTTITGQYPSALFSSAPGKLPVTYNPRMISNDLTTAVSTPNTLTRYDDFWPFRYDHFAPLTADFARPVNNLRFWVAGISPFRGNHIFDVDIYQRVVYKETWSIGSLGFNVNMYVNVGSPNNQLFGVNEVTKIVVKNIDDPSGLVFDEFTFETPPLRDDLKSPRIAGSLDGTTHKALAGGDIQLQAVPTYGGGSYSWSFTAPAVLVSGSANSSAVTLRSTDVGAITARVTYSQGGEHRLRDGQHQRGAPGADQLLGRAGARLPGHGSLRRSGAGGRPLDIRVRPLPGNLIRGRGHTPARPSPHRPRAGRRQVRAGGERDAQGQVGLGGRAVHHRPRVRRERRLRLATR